MRAFSSKDKGHSSRHSSFWLVSAFSGETFMAVGKVSPYTKQQSRRETHSLKKLAHLGDTHKRFGNPGFSVPTVVLDCQKEKLRV